MKFTKGALSLLLAGSLALGACGKVQQAPTATAPEPQAAEPIDPTVSRYGDPTKASTSPMHDALAATITDAANNTVIVGRAYFNLYSATEWPSKADSFPTTFDLRNRGVIAPVKSQNPWGTCWSFAAIAASESSILSSLNTTVEGYEQQYGEPLDLSEKHLAYFTLTPLPLAADYPDGDYPWDVSQQGEGTHTLRTEVDGPNAAYNTGGWDTGAAWAIASGIGVVSEKDFPYRNTDGADGIGDWSLPEENRFIQQYAIKNANILPVAATFDADGTYVYNPAGTEAMKSELLAGRAIVISYWADQSEPPLKPDSEEELRSDAELFTELTEGVDVEDMYVFLKLRQGLIDESEIPFDQLQRLVDVRLRMNAMDPSTYDAQTMTREQIMAVLMTDRHFGEPLEGLVEAVDIELNRLFIRYSGEDPVITAQYTFEPAESTHSVAVVGWDDTFSKENFLEGHQPPEDGAWIVRNSWGNEWGTDGYFYLSYYDQSLCAAMSFEYVMDAQDSETAHGYIMEYDFMPSELYASTLSDKPVYTANIFTAEGDCVLEYVSALTGDHNTDVTVSVYALSPDAQTPTDGVLVDSTSETFNYAGYHRVNLTRNVALNEGERVGIVVVERVPTSEGTKYALVNTCARSYASVDVYQEAHPDNMAPRGYNVGVVNQGESFASYDGEWVDWADEVAEIAANHELCNLLAYDNLPIKGYAYPLDEVKEAHQFDTTVAVPGGEASVCSDCGFVLTDVNE